MLHDRGFWWPDGTEGRRRLAIDRLGDLQAAVDLTAHRRVAVQAGGHVGIWPERLSRDFEAVYTFEPDFANFECLVRNAAADNVFSARGLLGADRGCRRLVQHKHNIGGHRGSKDAGLVPVYRIDDLCLDACDLIQLDIEGMEYPALQGAWLTLARHRPVVMVEAKGHDRVSKWGSHADVARLLQRLGYRRVAAVNDDRIFISR